MSSNPTRPPETTSASDSEERIKRFLATASHDLQSPLRHIAMYAELLLDDLEETLDGEQLQSLRMIMEKAQTAQRLTKALMSLAGGTPQVTPEEVDLQALAESVWGELTDETAVREAKLESEGLPSIRTDPALFGLVLRHLLTNALIYRGKRRRMWPLPRSARGRTGSSGFPTMGQASSPLIGSEYSSRSGNCRRRERSRAPVSD